MDIESIMTVLIIGFFVVITPGPNMVVVMKNTISAGTASGIITALGLFMGNLVHITYCLVGIGLIISKSIVAFNIIKILGALYLMYLGIKLLLSKQKLSGENTEAPVPNKTHFEYFANGLLTDLLNPKATLFFLALFTQIIKPGYSIAERIFYGSSVAVLEFICFTILSFILGNQLVKKAIHRFFNVIEKFTGVLLILLGIKILVTRDTD